jgi:two-component system, OmpR family, response regulator
VLLSKPILIIEDNTRICAHIVNIVTTAGYDTEHGPDARHFWELSKRQPHAAYVLDIGLPDADGTELIHQIRQSGDRTPILVLSAKGELDTKLTGLTNGADDYLTKPFHPRELIARLHALIRRAQSTADVPLLNMGRLTFDAAANEARVDGKPLLLTRGECAALGHLLRFHKRTVTREALRSVIYRGARMSENAIDKTISRLRRALIDSASGVHLVTLKGTGYMLTEHHHE